MIYNIVKESKKKGLEPKSSRFSTQKCYKVKQIKLYTVKTKSCVKELRLRYPQLITALFIVLCEIFHSFIFCCSTYIVWLCLYKKQKKLKNNAIISVQKTQAKSNKLYGTIYNKLDYIQANLIMNILYYITVYIYSNVQHYFDYVCYVQKSSSTFFQPICLNNL